MKNLESHLLNLLGEAERRVLELRLCGNQDNLQTKSLALWERRKRGLKKMLIGFEHASKYGRHNRERGWKNRRMGEIDPTRVHTRERFIIHRQRYRQREI